MPYAHLRIAGEPAGPDGLRHLHDEMTRIVASLLGKKAELTAVDIEEVPLSGWAVGTHRTKRVAHLEVLVTAGTNSPEQKERFIAAAYGLLREIFGADLHPVSYVVIRDLSADSWGYGGLTQAARR
ncbi:tautomerase family protein [Rhizobium sp. TRM95111]|uniref:tautomerase family protein n=1 Tax=Rhizobium alarense TaxID=2846851 RepID=UPI001F34DFF3|nr:tautomerase family protein [Rhizobium alarense]MCF3643359.1 tautomerase family protein [Rhizobium alarense]